VASKNNLTPKPNAKDNIDKWSHLTGHELPGGLSADTYTRDQIRALASKYGIKRYSSYKDMKELAKAVKETKGYKEFLSKNYKTIFEKIKELTKGESKSISWYKSTLKSISDKYTTENNRMTIEQKMESVDALVYQDENVLRRRVFPGHLYFFKYEAKTKTLPYYDKYPLTYVLSVNGSEFYGANLHYLKPKRRQIIIKKLQEGRIDIPQKIIHKYLNERCKSLFLDLAKQEWETAIFLPVEEFVLMKGGGRIDYPKEYVWEEMDQYWNDRIKGVRIIKGTDTKDIKRVN